MNDMDVGFETVFERVATPLKSYLEEHGITFELTAEPVMFFNTNFKFKFKGISQKQLDEIATKIEKLHERIGAKII